MRVPLMLLLITLTFAGCSTRSSRDPQRQLEERLMAPCCWRQNLADHDSPLAAELRGEISQRLAAGQPAAAIEQAFVSRYGERVRALGSGLDPRLVIGAVTGIATLAGLAFLLWFVRRRRHRTEPVPATGRDPGERASQQANDPADDQVNDRASDRLDDELAACLD